MFGLSRKARQSQGNDSLGLPAGHVVYYEDRHKRASNEQTAREVLDKRSAHRGWDGRWPCYVSLCATDGDPLSILHDPSALSFAIAVNLRKQFGVVTRGTIGKTGLVALCRPCEEAIRARELFRDD